MADTLKVMLHPARAAVIRGSQQIECNVTGSVSWERIVEVLRASGNIMPTEQVEALVLDDNGIAFYVRA